MNDLRNIREALGQCRLRINTSDRATHQRIDQALSALSRLEASAGEPVVRKSCSESCGPGDFYPGGKCDRMGCYTHPSPSPVPVELSVEDVSKMAEQIQNKARGFGQESMNHRFEGALDAIRHITKHYTLTPKQP